MSSSNTFSKLFGQSPFTALQEHMRVVQECAAEVQPLLKALAAGAVLLHPQGNVRLIAHPYVPPAGAGFPAPPLSIQTIRSRQCPKHP